MELTVDSINDLDLSKTYTYADYVMWRFEERLELIRGKVFQMSPAPGVNHQRVIVNLVRPISNFLFKKSCEVFVSPFDVRFIKEGESEKKIKTVVQPDLCVICDPQKVADNRTCLGSPDLIVEILSPGNNKKELKIKFDLYEEFGVREYWVVYPNEQSVIRYVLTDGRFVTEGRALTLGDKITTSILPGFELPLDDVFYNLS